MKSAVVTGSGHGIGRATAEALLRAGYAVMLCDADDRRLADARGALAKLGRVEAVLADVASEPDVARVVSRTVEAFGGIDLVVNNAAIADPSNAPIAELTLEDWNRKLAVNLTSVFLFAKHAVAALRERKGAIVNMSSTRALMSEPNTEIYATAKGGIDALTHALAISLGPDVRVNAVRPGWIDTQGKPLRKKDHEQHPAGRVGRPEDVGDLVVYLASAGFVTGQTFTIDGGMTRKMIYAE